jgi:hypothetical protein
VTIAIVGLAVVVLVGALATGISASSGHRQRATADTVARSVAEAIKDRNVALDPNGSYLPILWASTVNTTGFNVVPSATCLKASDVSAINLSASNFAACNSSTTGLQMITIDVTSTGGKAERESVTILKRRT